MYRRFGDRVEFIGINLGFREKISEYMKENNLNFPVAYDEGEKILSSFGAKIPMFMLVDVNGRIRYRGAEPPEDVKKSLQELLR